MTDRPLARIPRIHSLLMLRHSYYRPPPSRFPCGKRKKDTLFKKTRRLMTETYNVKTQRCT